MASKRCEGLTMNEVLKRRTNAEYETVNLRPWHFAPSEVQAAPNPYPAGCVGFESWKQATAQWRELVAARSRAPSAL